MARKYPHNFENHLYLQRVSPKTREAYLRSVAEISAFHQMPPAELTNDQIPDKMSFHYPFQQNSLPSSLQSSKENPSKIFTSTFQ